MESIRISFKFFGIPYAQVKGISLSEQSKLVLEVDKEAVARGTFAQLASGNQIHVYSGMLKAVAIVLRAARECGYDVRRRHFIQAAVFNSVHLKPRPQPLR